MTMRSLSRHVGAAGRPGASPETLLHQGFTKCIYLMQIDISTDHIRVMLNIGIEENEDWAIDEFYHINHSDFESWLEKNERLSFDDTTHSAGYDGEHVESGGVYTVSYTEYITCPQVYDHKADLIAYMLETKIIPPYKIIEI